MLISLAWKNVRRDKLRTTLTILSVAVTTFAFLLLQTVTSSWDNQATGSTSYVMTRQRASWLIPMPYRYAAEIREIPGVQAATPYLWFGGRLESRRSEEFSSVAVEPRSFLDVQEGRVIMAPEERQTWLTDRQSAAVGKKLAERVGLKVGDRFALVSLFYGVDPPIQFTVAAIYTTTTSVVDEDTALLRYDYVNELLPVSRREGSTLILSKLTPGTRYETVAKAIDDHFENAVLATRTTDENSFYRNMLTFLRTTMNAIQMISAILLALICLIVGNSIAMSVRERTREYGFLRAVGFGPRSVYGLIVGEAGFSCGLGATVGAIAASQLINRVLGPLIEREASQLFSSFHVAPTTLGIVIVSAVGLGVLAGTLPAVRALRIRTIDAIRSIG